MIIVDVQKEKGIESALKIYKARVLKSKQIQHLKDRQTYVKPSVEKRTALLKAKYMEKIKNGLD